mmetsp:Transcript_3915/g.5832  ORF Transcript_3915/g.5832 Transcript_3915/m.5832 type:complete len:83 (+) Transcript_3915:1177-1425(+)
MIAKTRWLYIIETSGPDLQRTSLKKIIAASYQIIITKTLIKCEGKIHKTYNMMDIYPSPNTVSHLENCKKRYNKVFILGCFI